jgi:hypothetical protein
MLRSLTAVGGGFIAMTVVVIIGTAAATAAFVPGGLSAAMSQTAPDIGPLPRTYLAANLLVSLIGAVLAGWIAARFSPSSSGTHVLVLAAIMLLMSVATFAQGAAPGQPVWYPWVIGAIGVGGLLIGGQMPKR